MQGRLEEAKKIMVLISNTEEEAEERFRDILAAAEIEEDGAVKAVGRGVWRELVINPTPAVRLILIAAVGYIFRARDWDRSRRFVQPKDLRESWSDFKRQALTSHGRCRFNQGCFYSNSDFLAGQRRSEKAFVDEYRRYGFCVDQFSDWSHDGSPFRAVSVGLEVEHRLCVHVCSVFLDRAWAYNVGVQL
uniref:Uncharacterized protein n=1 Tax=Brassica oleracea TaxID=3712 RepID=A0A3P6DR11_BRAOL|nr:unnamed protein product [Brassica oleracea]